MTAFFIPMVVGIETLENQPHVQAMLLPGQITPQRWARRLLKLPPDVEFLAPSGGVRARICHGRWVVDCPFCKSAMDGSYKYPWFWCVECKMQKNQHRPMNVYFPPQRQRIEACLMRRPNKENRNWEYPETLEVLRLENIAHGILSEGA